MVASAVGEHRYRGNQLALDQLVARQCTNTARHERVVTGPSVGLRDVDQGQQRHAPGLRLGDDRGNQGAVRVQLLDRPDLARRPHRHPQRSRGRDEEKRTQNERPRMGQPEQPHTRCRQNHGGHDRRNAEPPHLGDRLVHGLGVGYIDRKLESAHKPITSTSGPSTACRAQIAGPSRSSASVIR